MGKVKVKKGSGALLDAGCPICGTTDMLSQNNRTRGVAWVVVLILVVIAYAAKVWPLYIVAFFVPLFGNVKYWHCGECGWKSE